MHEIKWGRLHTGMEKCKSKKGGNSQLPCMYNFFIVGGFFKYPVCLHLASIVLLTFKTGTAAYFL